MAEEALAARHPLQGEAPRRWLLSASDIEVRPVREGPLTVAFELSVPLAESDTEVRALVQELTAAAKEGGWVVVDPQLNRLVTVADENAVADQFRTNARYVADHTGVPGLTGLGVSPAPRALPFSGRMIAAFFGFIVLALLLSDTCTRLLSATR